MCFMRNQELRVKMAQCGVIGCGGEEERTKNKLLGGELRWEGKYRT